MPPWRHPGTGPCPRPGAKPAKPTTFAPGVASARGHWWVRPRSSPHGPGQRPPPTSPSPSETGSFPPVSPRPHPGRGSSNPSKRLFPPKPAALPAKPSAGPAPPGPGPAPAQARPAERRRTDPPPFCGSAARPPVPAPGGWGRGLGALRGPRRDVPRHRGVARDGR